MKAVLWTAYGSPDVLQLEEVEKPAPKDHEVLIRVCATTVTSGDCEMRSLTSARWYTLLLRAYVGLKTPKRITTLGMELAGEVEAVGKNVKRFKVGDKIFAATGVVDLGTCSEYKCLPEDGLIAIKPGNMTYEEATTVPVGGLEALSFLRQANVQSGQKVLINGAGGTIGTFALQLAKYFGAEVTGVDSTEKLEMLRSIGADHVVDYTKEDYTSSRETYDVILDMIGSRSFSGNVKLLAHTGRYLLANPSLSHMVRGLLTSVMSSKRVIIGKSSQSTEDLIFLKELIEADRIKSVIDRCYPLEQTAEAHRYVETGHKQGHVVVTMARHG